MSLEQKKRQHFLLQKMADPKQACMNQDRDSEVGCFHLPANCSVTKAWSLAHPCQCEHLPPQQENDCKQQSSQGTFKCKAYSGPEGKSPSAWMCLTYGVLTVSWFLLAFLKGWICFYFRMEKPRIFFNEHISG